MMQPAFTGPKQAAALSLLLFGLLVAPAVVARTGVLVRSEAYETLPTYAGPISHLHHEIFEDSDPIDIAFVGSSFMWSAIDAPYLKDELSAALGREANVTVLASVWPGLDRDFAILKDLVERRQIGMVVLQFPTRRLPTDDPAIEVNTVSDDPHVQAFRFYQYGEFGDALDGLQLKSRVALYASAILGLPRQLLTLVRPNLMTRSGFEDTYGARFEDHGYYGAPYEPVDAVPPTLTLDDFRMSEETRDAFSFHGEPAPPYQMHFARRIGALLSEHRIPAVFIHIPAANELDAGTVQERVDWREVTGLDATVLGIPPVRLFGDYSRDEALRFFVSDHLNANGTRYFTRALAPALIEEFLTR